MDKNKIVPNKPVLGKGLASLLPGAVPPAPPLDVLKQTPASGDDTNRDRHPGISMCSIEEIAANDFQPRKTFHDETIDELAQSIKANGLIQPLIVRKTIKGYQLIAGERRLRAAKLAGLRQVPIVIRRTTDKESLELALIENIQREELNCVETALAYYQLVNDFDLKQEDLATRVGKERSSVANHLRLLKLPKTTQLALKDGLLSFGHGKILAGIENQNFVEKLTGECIDRRWSVRDLENHLKKLENLKLSRGEPVEPADPIQVRLKTIGKDLSAKFSTKVQLRGNAKRGKIIFEYYSDADLDRLLQSVMK